MPETNLKKRVLWLTDGGESMMDRVFGIVREYNDRYRVFGFGLGNGADQTLVKQTSKEGRGTHSFAKDNDPMLNSLVIKALSAAMEPSYKETQYGFNDDLTEG